jgi:hypothetical protein
MPHEGNNYIYTSEEVSISFTCLQFGDHMRASIPSLKPLSPWPLDDNTSPWIIFIPCHLGL